MNPFLQDPDEIRLPPEEVRLLDMQVNPQPDGRKVKIYLELTPFQKRPNIEVTITTASGRVSAHSSLLETMLRKLEFTLHLRQPEPGVEYNLESIVYYQKMPEMDESSTEVSLPEPMVVDQRILTFMFTQESTGT